MKICSKCLKELPEEQFAWKKVNVRRQSCCKSCHKTYRTAHYHANRDESISRAKNWREQEKIRFYEWLFDKCCVDCGNNDWRVLEFDHQGDKSYNIAEKVGQVSLETLMLEIAKCEIVCANCHRLRTALKSNQYKFLTDAKWKV